MTETHFLKLLHTWDDNRDRAGRLGLESKDRDASVRTMNAIHSSLWQQINTSREILERSKEDYANMRIADAVRSLMDAINSEANGHE